MFKIKKRLEEILSCRTNQKCYLIYEQSGDFYIVYGSYFRNVLRGDLYDLLMNFHLDKTGWSFTNRHIKHDRENNKEWRYIDNEIKQMVLDIDTLYIDGESSKLI